MSGARTISSKKTDHGGGNRQPPRCEANRKGIVIKMNELNVKDANVRRPRILQGSSAPVFSGSSNQNLFCKCSQILIRGYIPRQYIDLDIQCFSCKTVFTTEQWPLDEALPLGLISIGRSGHYNLMSTVDTSNLIGIISEQNIELTNSRIGVKPSNSKLNLTHEGMCELETLLDEVSSGDFRKSLLSTTRAFELGNDKFLKFPAAWAIHHLKKIFAEGVVDISIPEDNAAIAHLYLLSDLFSRWQHHPLFKQSARGCALEFHHTVTQLMVASYLADHGNPIGFTNTKVLNGQSPDLYINNNTCNSLSIEVKAPPELQWPNASASTERLEKIIDKQLRKARDQITGTAGGLVAIGALTLNHDEKNKIDLAIQSLINRKKVSTRILAIASVVRFLYPVHFEPGMGSFRFGCSFAINIHKNPRFEGEDILQTELLPSQP